MMIKMNMLIRKTLLQSTLCYHSCNTRYYSKIVEYHVLMFELIENVSQLHNRYRSTFLDHISVEECEKMMDDIRCGFYQLSPIQVNNIKNEEFKSFLKERTVQSSAICGLLHCFPGKEPGYTTVVRPSHDKDVLLIAALERVLLENTVNWKCPSIESLVYDFHSDINRMVSVNRIYRIDISFPEPMGKYLKNISQINLRPDTRLYQFLSTFLNLPYIDEDGMCLETLNGSYTVGELSKIAQNLVLKETFDYEFRKEFPEVAFTRFVNQVIIGTKDDDWIVFNENDGYQLLNKLGLTGKILSIGRGDAPITCYGDIDLCISGML
jgi:hypothetical protein